MKILSAEFVTSAVDARGIPRDGLPHIALVGRSNVGKSTLINALAGRKIAHTSATPGKTRLANLYRLHVQGGRPDASGAPASWRFYFADLPGYGYAKGGKAALDQFAAVADAYFQGPIVSGQSPGARGQSPVASGQLPAARGQGPADRRLAVLLVVDARHPGLDADFAARDWVLTLGVPHLVVATKIDKLSRSSRARAVRDIGRDMNAPVVPFSATTGEGLDDLWTHIVMLASN